MKPLTFFTFFCFLLSGCKVGPNYTRPDVYMPDNFIEDVPEETELVEDCELIHWWETFNDPVLNNLIEIALSENFDYRTAFERVYQARAQYQFQFTQILPELDGSMTASRFRTSESFLSRQQNVIPTVDISPFQNFYQVSIAAVWEIDLWGKFRRAATSSYDLWQATADDMQGVKIVVVSEVANTYASILALQQKLDIAKQVVQLDEEILELATSRFEAGIANRQEVESATASLEGDLSQLALGEASLRATIYSLGTLLGALPEIIMENFCFEGEIPRSANRVPISLPADLLRRRPDVRSAERQLAAATEEIGVAMADLFPTLSLTGSSGSFASNPLQGANIGVASDRLNKLFKPASLIWGIGGFVTMPIFDFGKRSAVVDIQVALRNQRYFAYQKTVITAIQETEQALTNYFNQEKSLISLERQVAANNNSLNLVTGLFQAGLANYTDVLVVRDTWLQSQYALADAKRALMVDLVAVYKALGGNW